MGAVPPPGDKAPGEASVPKQPLAKRVLEKADENFRILFAVPAIAVMALLLLYPLMGLLKSAFYEHLLASQQEPVFIGLGNFVRALHDEHFWRAIWLMLYFAFGSVGLQFLLGFGLALLLNREFKGESMMRMLLMFPLIATPVSMSLTWQMMYDPTIGVFNYLLGLIGIGPQGFASDTAQVMPSLILAEVWHWTPMMMLILLAGLRNLPRHPYEAAIIDGASRTQIFFKVTLPLMRPYIFVVLLLRLIHGLRVFDKIFVISGGGPDRASETLIMMIYHAAFESLDYGYSSALSMVLMLICLTITLLVYPLRERGWRY